MMKQLDEQVARRLSRFYVIALTVIAVLSISGLLFIRQTISTHYDDGRVVNVAGRQRMLSQRLTKQALLRMGSLSTTDTVSFDSLLHSWSQSHIQLRNGILRMEKVYTVRKSVRLDSMFARIEPTYQSIYTGFTRINNPNLTAAGKNDALRVILQNEFSYLQQMNAIVFQVDTESFERVKSLERIEWLLTLATLLTVFVEGLFIFRPVVNQTKRVIRRLARSEKALQLANNHMEVTNREMEATNQNLAVSNRIVIDTQQELLRTTEEKYQLQRAEDQVRSAALLEGQEEERRRFARELHDGIGQMLTGLKLHAEKLKSVSFADEKQRLRVAELCDLIADTIQTTRQVSYNLMPSTLSDFGLGATLQLLAEQTTRSAGLSVVFTGPRDIGRLGPPVEIGLYRIAQEALHNTVKHAHAQAARITLKQTGHKLSLSIEDDGKGFVLKDSPVDEKRMPTSNGLDNMRTRARLLNGELTITSKPKKGTRVMLCVQLASRSQ